AGSDSHFKLEFQSVSYCFRKLRFVFKLVFQPQSSLRRFIIPVFASFGMRTIQKSGAEAHAALTLSDITGHRDHSAAPGRWPVDAAQPRSVRFPPPAAEDGLDRSA